MMRMAKVLRNGVIDRARENALADITSMSVATNSREKKVAQLSGGNQQKVVISKCLNRESDVLLMGRAHARRRRGRKQEIHDIIREPPGQGKGIIVFSSELPEIVQLCDRIGADERRAGGGGAREREGHRQRPDHGPVAGGVCA